MTTPTRLDVVKGGNVYGSAGKESHVERAVLVKAINFGLRGSHSAATPQGESQGLKTKQNKRTLFLPPSDLLPGIRIAQIQIDAAHVISFPGLRTEQRKVESGSGGTNRRYSTQTL